MAIRFSKLLVITLSWLVLSSCDSDDGARFLPNENFNQDTRGAGFFEFKYQFTTGEEPIKIHYFVPTNKASDSEVLVVLHGLNRNAVVFRNTMQDIAEERNAILIVPEFSEERFPGASGFNFGNVYTNGNNPTFGGLNLETDWSFSIIEPLFDYVVTQLQLNISSYKMYGHSAGAQFVHRFLLFKPNNRCEKFLVSASGWYTLVDNEIPFPYGLDNSILFGRDLSHAYRANVIVQVGENDNDPNDPTLRNNEFTLQQGAHRKERAEFYYNFHQEQAGIENSEFNWEFVIVPNANHDIEPASINAANLLLN